ncbi:MAG: hypothetical protein KDB82_04175 [Planctomycetes bacterium]|nr:hypothetical protein [Planctomycetota bacterium]
MNGNAVGVRQNVVRAQHPGPGGNAPYAGHGGPVNYGGYDDGAVEVAADVAYGARTNKKSLTTVIILVVLGLGIVGTLAFIVNVLSDPTARQQQAKQEREVVLDPKEFEKAVDESVVKVENLLKRVPNAEVQRTSNFAESLSAIQAGGGTPPTWNNAPAPGSPFRTQGFQVKALDEKNNRTHVGFVMLLYYKTAEEVEKARAEIDREIGGDTRNYGIYANPAMWYIAYTGVNFKGKLKDSLDSAMRLGAPSGYRQFTDRVGSTMREELKH